jgi:hypothetical protein
MRKKGKYVSDEIFDWEQELIEKYQVPEQTPPAPGMPQVMPGPVLPEPALGIFPWAQAPAYDSHMMDTWFSEIADASHFTFRHDYGLTCGYTRATITAMLRERFPQARLLAHLTEADQDEQGILRVTAPGGGEVIAEVVLQSLNSPNISLSGTATAMSIEDVRWFAREITRDHPPLVMPPPVPDNSVQVKFTYVNRHGQVIVFDRRLTVPSWEEIKANYADGDGKLDWLVNVQISDLHGKIGILHGEPGSGKDQPVSEPVLTPSGWCPIGTLSPGDQVIGSDGAPVTVTGVFPQGMKPVYRLSFSDGAEVRAGLDHLWRVSERVGSDRKEVVISTREMLTQSLVMDNGRRRYRAPLAAPVRLARQALPVDPYLLGLLLGNGSFRNASETGFTSADDQLVQALRTGLPEGTELKNRGTARSNEFRITTAQCGTCGGRWGGNPLLSILEELGLQRKHAVAKFIPDAYLQGDPQDRLALLQGLMDTDGTCDVQGTAMFSTSSSQLASDVADLVRSLGGLSGITVRSAPKYSYRGEQRTGQPGYRVRVGLPEGQLPFRLERKAERYAVRKTFPAGRYITSIVREDYDEESVCIKVDAPDELYVTKDYVLTHNTTFLRALFRQWKSQSSIIYITDPEAFFTDAGYRNELLLQHTRSGRWNVLVFEDSEKYITSRREGENTALTQLLNIGDGMIGQGLQLIMLFTTNAERHALDRAVTRPGRCFVNTEIPAFDPDQAQAWLKEHGKDAKVTKSMTLAELYAELAR